MENYEIIGETDATKWAKFWLETLEENPEIATDEGTMIGWFANAIMAGVDSVRPQVLIDRLEVRAGDLLHVKYGGYIGPDQPDYIPSPEDRAALADELEKLLPEGVTAWVTHHLVYLDKVIRPES
jgi:hypothetical protein